MMLTSVATSEISVPRVTRIGRRATHPMVPLVVIDADDGVPHFGEANCGYKTDIPGTDDGNITLFRHSLLNTLSRIRRRHGERMGNRIAIERGGMIRA